MLIKENKIFSKFSTLVVFLIFLICGLFSYLNYSSIEFKNTKKGTITNLSETTSSTVNVVNSFGEKNNIKFPVKEGLSVKYSGAESLEEINDKDIVLTYNSPRNINLNTIPLDVLTGEATIGKINLDNCVDLDQVAVEYVSKKCLNFRCYDNFGNKITQGTTIENLEIKNNIPRCNDNMLGYLSFNFYIDSLTNTVSSNTQFMQFENIYLGTSVYNNYLEDKYLDYFFTNNIFLEDKTIDKDKIVPRIVHRNLENNSVKQKILIKRYGKKTNNLTTNTTFESDINGNLAELIFRPLDLFLDAESVNNSITSISTVADLKTLNYSNNYKVRTVKQGSRTNAKCIIDSDYKIRIIDGGSNYNPVLNLTIEDDNNTFPDIPDTFIFSIAPVAKRLILKDRAVYTDEERAVWLLAPPLDLSPEGITKSNKLTKGYIKNFSSQSPINNINKALPGLPLYRAVKPGTVISPIEFRLLENSFNTSNNFTIFDNTKNTQGLYDIITNTDPNADNGQPMNKAIYKEYPDYLLKSVNTFPALANPVNLTNNGIVKVNVSQANGPIGGFITGNSFIVTVYVTASNTNLTTSLEDNIILDGSAEWLQINPFENVLAFSNDYFTQPVLRSNNSVNLVSDITANDLKFVEPIFGKIKELNVDSLDYSSIEMPNLTSSLVIDLNSENLELAENSKGVIGKDAQCLLSFGKEGTSTVVNFSQILKPGSSFSTGSFNLLGNAIQTGLSGSIKNLLITSFDDSYTFKAVTVSQTNNLQTVSPAAVSEGDFNIIYGLVIEPVSNNTISLQNPLIINGGQNYLVGDTYYINQYIDNSVNSVFGTSFDIGNISNENLTRLPRLQVTSTILSGTSFQPSNYALIKDEETIIEYNFWQDSPGLYNNSPQQLIYYGDFIGVSTSFIGDPAKDLRSFFLNNKIDDSTFTTVDFLSSLQIPSFYYNENGYQEIKPYEGLILKRFIPYQDFTPPVKNNQNDIIATKKGTTKYTNYNYTQFVPYGIDNIYKKTFSSDLSNLATF